VRILRMMRGEILKARILKMRKKVMIRGGSGLY